MSSMDIKDVPATVSVEAYNELSKKLQASELEKNRLARELRTAIKQNEIYRLNSETQYGLAKTITREKLKQEMYVKLLLQSCPDIIFVFDDTIKFLLGTDSITSIINIDDVSLLYGKDIETISKIYNPPVFTDEMLSSIKMIISHQHATKEILKVSTETNQYETHLLSFTKDTGEFAGILVVMNDITELSSAKAAAERASNAKTDFLSRMSHEMRTPMNAIIGMTNIAKKTKDPEKKEYCLDKIDVASRHLLGVINDILDMSKIEADKFELSRHMFDFEKMLMNVTNVLNFRIEEKKQNLIINLDTDIPQTILGDELRLTQVLTNLLTNAVKFTPDGGTIMLNVKNSHEPDHEDILQIEVVDTGIGISGEQQARLFSAFEQADGGTARKFGGTGLGLAIAKRIVELMGGKIWIESELGKGAAFIFTFKFARGEAMPRPKLNMDKKDIRILAVDDAPEIREYFTDVMATFELSCDVAADGCEALALIKNRQDNPYNIFFIDWLMPNMDGLELIKKIKENTRDNAIIIMISATLRDEIEAKTGALDIDRFIAKPLFPSVLLQAVNDCMGTMPGDSPGGQIADAGAACGYNGHVVLIAEDVAINREIIAAVLEETGITIDFAENGVEALAKFQTNPDRYSLILMDIQMPEMDGYAATRSIRALDCAQAGTIPIIAMTANVFKDDIENCFKAGMNSHLGKPVDVAVLMEQLDRYLPAAHAVSG